MTNNLLNNKIKKCAALIAVGIVFVLYLLIWFKQYTYFNYSGGEDHFDDAELTAYASTAVEKPFELDPGYPTKVGRIIFWTNKFSDIEIVNESSDTWQFTVSDYFGNDVEAAMDPFVLGAGESFAFVADGRSGYVVTAYGHEDAADTDGLCVRYGSHAYMGRWKKATVITLGLMSAILALLCLWALISYMSFNKVSPYICLLLGGLCFIVSEYTGIAGTEAYLTALPQMGAVYLGVLALVCGYGVPCKENKYELKDTNNIGDVAVGNDFKTVNIISRSCKYLNPPIWLIISAFVAITLHFFMLSAGADSVLYAFTGGENSGKRIAGYIVVFGVFLILYLCLGHIKLSRVVLDTFKSFFSGRTALLSVILCILALARAWMGAKPIVIGLLVLGILALHYSKNFRFPKVIRIVYYCVLALLVGANSCVINFWDTGRWGDVYHTGTFYNSLFFVAAGQPFRGGLSQMYGHFGMFYKIPMFIFGNNMCTIGVTTAFWAAVAVLLALLSMDRILKSDVAKLLAGPVLIAYLIIDILYLQTFPLRMLWPFVLLYYCTWTMDKEINLQRRLIGYSICTLAILWNTESGLVCAVCWSVCIVIHREQKLTVKRLIVEGALEVLAVIAELFMAYSVVKMYNICTMTSGSAIAEFLSWKKELATLARSEAGDTSNGSLYWVNAPWMYIELALMAGVALLLDRAGFFRERRYSGSDITKTMLVFYAAGIFIYWMGRPESYNPVAPYIGCLVVILYDHMVSLNCHISSDDNVHNDIDDRDAMIKNTEKRNVSDREESVVYSSKFGIQFDYKYNLHMVVEFIVCLVLACFLAKMPDIVKYTKHNLIDRSLTDYSKVEHYLRDYEKEIPETADGEAVG